MQQYKNSIKYWAIEDRPREKLLQKGIATLSDAELIAIIIGSGTKKMSALDLSKNILAQNNYNLNELGKLTVNDLTKIKGIGEAKAITIIAALELGKRRKVNDVIQKMKITKSEEVFHIFHPMLCDIPHEEFWIMLLNRSNLVIDKVKISQGGIAGTVIDVRLIMKHAIEKLASAIILCHNHPSGNLTPSEPDKTITRKLAKAGEVMDINVLDHVIITDSKYFSFADENLM